MPWGEIICLLFSKKGKVSRMREWQDGEADECPAQSPARAAASQLAADSTDLGEERS